MLPNALGNEYLILWDLLQQLLTSNNVEDGIDHVRNANQILIQHRYNAIQFSKNEIYLSNEKFQFTEIINFILNRVHIIRKEANKNGLDDHFERNGMLQDFEYILLRIGSSGQSPKAKLNELDVREFLTTYFVNNISMMMRKYPNQCKSILITLMKLGLSVSNQDPDNHKYNIKNTSSYTNTISQIFSIYSNLLDERYIYSLKKKIRMSAAG